MLLDLVCLILLFFLVPPFLVQLFVLGLKLLAFMWRPFMNSNTPDEQWTEAIEAAHAREMARAASPNSGSASGGLPPMSDADLAYQRKLNRICLSVLAVGMATGLIAAYVNLLNSSR